MTIYSRLLTFLLYSYSVVYLVTSSLVPQHGEYKIDGKVVMTFTSDTEWITNTRVMVDGGEYIGLLRPDGTFTINNVPSGSYIVEVVSSTYVFPPARVDINSKGKMRARKVNLLQPSEVTSLSYPLKFKAQGKAAYFQQREQWRIQDIVANPMIMMMVAPFLLLMVLPKLVNNDPETQREMANQMNMFNPKQNMPDMSEMFTKFFGGAAPSNKKAVKSKPDIGTRKKNR